MIYDADLKATLSVDLFVHISLHPFLAASTGRYETFVRCVGDVSTPCYSMHQFVVAYTWLYTWGPVHRSVRPSVCLSVCPSVRKQDIGPTFWPSNQIFGLSDPWDMRKKRIFLFFEILIFSLFIGIFRFFPYITLVHFLFQATGQSFSPRGVLFGLRRQKIEIF